jgi:hypothetical protein
MRSNSSKSSLWKLVSGQGPFGGMTIYFLIFTEASLTVLGIHDLDSAEASVHGALIGNVYLNVRGLPSSRRGRSSKKQVDAKNNNSRSSSGRTLANA